MTTATQKKRLWRVLFLWGALLTAGIGYGLFCSRTGVGIPCILHQLTGLDCPGYNAIWPIILGYLLWIGLGVSVAYVKRGEVFYLPGKTRMHAVVLAVIVIYGTLRNFI